MKQKEKPDIVLGNYWKDNEHFADLCNAVYYDGQRVILPEDLEEMDSDVSHLLEHRDSVENIKAARDIIKIAKYSRKHQIQLAVLGIENQDKIHYAMPLRVMEYDAYSYKKQYDENAKNYPTKEGLTDEEFLSKMKQTDKFMPVITTVLYYGEKVWDGAKTLKEMLTIPQELEEYVNDYRMHLVEIRDSGLKLNNRHNRDLFQICGILYNHAETREERKKRVIEYTEENKVDSGVLKAVGATVGKEIKVKKKEAVNMCTFFDELEKECRQEGEKIGEERGRFQMAERVVKNAMEKLGMSLEAACELAEITVEKYKEYMTMAKS